MTTRTLTLLAALALAGAATEATAQVTQQADPVRVPLWHPEETPCILTYNPQGLALDLPEPYFPKTLAERYGPGTTEADLVRQAAPSQANEFPESVTLNAVGTNIIMTVAYGDGPGEGFNDPTLGSDRRAAFEAGMAVWTGLLQGPGNVSINATMTPRGGTVFSATLASAAPAQWWRNFTNAPIANTYYPEGLVDVIQGSDPDTGTLDINVDFNSDIDNSTVLGTRDFYYGLDGNPGTDFDFLNITIHELAHGLGFADSFTSTGSFGLNPGGWPTVYDRFVVNAAGTNLVNLPVSSANVTSPVFWEGPIAGYAHTAEHLFDGTGEPPLFAPTTFNGGSSIAHLDEATYTGEWDLQTPNYDEAIHDPDRVMLAVLEDIGWSIERSRYADDGASGFQDGSSANPFDTVLEAVNGAPFGGAARLLPGVYSEAFTITGQNVLLRSYGTAVIGPAAGSAPQTAAGSR